MQAKTISVEQETCIGCALKPNDCFVCPFWKFASYFSPPLKPPLSGPLLQFAQIPFLWTLLRFWIRYVKRHHSHWWMGHHSDGNPKWRNCCHLWSTESVWLGEGYCYPNLLVFYNQTKSVKSKSGHCIAHVVWHYHWQDSLPWFIEE